MEAISSSETLVTTSNITRHTSPEDQLLNIHCQVDKNLPLDPNLSQMNPVHIFTHCALKIHFNIILLPTFELRKWYLPVTSFLTKIFYVLIYPFFLSFAPQSSLSHGRLHKIRLNFLEASQQFSFLQGRVVAPLPTPIPEDQASVFISPRGRVATHFSRLLRYACLFKSPHLVSVVIFREE
jgi:hypothetical protein